MSWPGAPAPAPGKAQRRLAAVAMHVGLRIRPAGGGALPSIREQVRGKLLHGQDRQLCVPAQAELWPAHEGGPVARGPVGGHSAHRGAVPYCGGRSGEVPPRVGQPSEAAKGRPAPGATAPAGGPVDSHPVAAIAPAGARGDGPGGPATASWRLEPQAVAAMRGTSGPVAAGPREGGTARAPGQTTEGTGGRAEGQREWAGAARWAAALAAPGLGRTAAASHGSPASPAGPEALVADAVVAVAHRFQRAGKSPPPRPRGSTEPGPGCLKSVEAAGPPGRGGELERGSHAAHAPNHRGPHGSVLALRGDPPSCEPCCAW